MLSLTRKFSCKLTLNSSVLSNQSNIRVNTLLKTRAVNYRQISYSRNLFKDNDVIGDINSESEQIRDILDQNELKPVPSPEMEQGVPIQEILKREKDALKDAPEVLKEEIERDEIKKKLKLDINLGTNLNSSQPKEMSNHITRSITLADISKILSPEKATAEELFVIGQKLRGIREMGGLNWYSEDAKAPIDPAINSKLLIRLNQAEKGFGITSRHRSLAKAYKGKPIPELKNQLLEKIANLLMKDGKKAKARKTLARTLYYIYLKTRENPLEILEQAFEAAGPLMDLKSVKLSAMKNQMVPKPLSGNQRVRRAFVWIKEAADKRSSRSFAVRFGDELFSVAKGSSNVLAKRDQLHRTCVAHRANIRIKRVSAF